MIDYPREFTRLRKKIECLREGKRILFEERKTRVQKAMNYEEPDRVPVMCGFPMDWWLKKRKIPWSSYLNDPGLQFTENIRLGIYNAVELDADGELPTGYDVNIDVGVEVVESSVLGCRIKYVEDDYPWLDLTSSPFSSPGEIKKYRVPEEYELEALGVMPKIKRFVDYAHENALRVNGIIDGEGPFELCCFAYGTTNFLLLLKEDPSLAKELLEKMTLLRIRQSAIFKKWFDSYDPMVGENNIDMISPDQFAEFVFPYDSAVYAAFPEDTPHWHTDACADRILDLVAEYRTKSFEVSDTTSLKLAKEKLSPHRTLLTGNLPERLLVTGGDEEIEKAVKKCIETAAAGGGYILSPNGLMRDADRKKLSVMIEAAKKYGRCYK